MARRNIDLQALRQQIQELYIYNELKSQLLNAVSEQKKYGLVWENHKEDAEEVMREKLPVLIEDNGKRLDKGGEDAPNHILIEGDNGTVCLSRQRQKLTSRILQPRTTRCTTTCRSPTPMVVVSS